MSCNSQGANEVVREEQAAKAAMAVIPHKILVMSGKGGVGKTTVSVNLACALTGLGYRCGIVDADMHGPNVALMTGIEGSRVKGSEGRIEPVEAAAGIKVLSVASFLPDRSSPVVWRGPRKSSMIRTLLGLGDWSDIDVLVVDCPPGTGDEPMTVAQLIPDADGVVVVTTPQDVALLDSRKCVNFVRDVDLPVLGIVENLSGYVCPKCGHHLDLFKRGGGEAAAKELDVPFLGRIPISGDMVRAGDDGLPLVIANGEDIASIALLEIANRLKLNWKQGGDAAETGEPTNMSKRNIAIAAEDDRGMDGEVSQHFGRCPYYVMVEVDGEAVTGSRVEANPHYNNHQPGQMPLFIKQLGADVIIAGGMGPRAVNMFLEMDIEVATGATGVVGKVLEAYLRGEISGIVPCSHDHPESCGGH